jgi:5-methylcytosine-specific restriction enzyme B
LSEDGCAFRIPEEPLVAKLTRAITQPVYDAAQQFVDRCLRVDDSLFTPGRAIWSLAVCEDLHARFVGQPDSSKDTFENKFRRQLAEAPPAINSSQG